MKMTDIVNGLWAITPDMLNEIQNIYALHMRGEKIDIPKLEARLGRSISNDRRYMEVSNGLAVLSLHGVIAKRANLFMDISGGVSTQIASEEFKEALNDPEVKSILLDIDSPGGAVDGTFEFAELIRDSRGIKPITVFSDGSMTSGAFAIGSAADKIFISGETAITGSIGVITRHMDYSRWLDREGITATEFIAGKFKNVGTDIKPLSDSDKDVIQGHIDHIYTVFVNTVAENRNISVDTHELWADGQIFMGSKAIELGLVDGVSTRDKLIEQLTGGDPVSSQSNTNTTMVAVGGVPVAQEDSMNRTELEAKHPELYTEVFGLGVASVDVAGITATATAAGAATETARVKEVLAQNMTGYEKDVLALAVDGKSTGGDVAMMITGKMQKQNETAAAAIEADADTQIVVPDAQAGPTGADAPDISTMSVEDAAKHLYETRAEIKAEFVDLESFTALYKTDPSQFVTA
jgi:signal peptide peptidase SppA